MIYICRKISFSSNNPKYVEPRNLKNYVQRDFNYDLHHALLMLNWEINNPNMLWNNFRTTFNYVADIHAPIQGRKVRNMKAPWLTDAIKKSMNRRDYLMKKAVKTNSSAYHNAYKNRNNSKQLWKHINQLLTPSLQMYHSN